MNQNNDNDNKPNTDAIDMADTQFFAPDAPSEQESQNLSTPTSAAQLNNSGMAHFKIIDILGKGGMGAVYKAKDLALERFVAIKMIRLSADAIRANESSEQPLMLAEAKTISKLNHPNIVTVYDIARDGDANFIVMEWVDGSPLNAVIPSNGLAISVVLNYAQQMVAALACAHKQHIIHRDIKPQNIMVGVSGRIKILDFGIAALIEPEKPLANETLANSTRSTETQSAPVAGSPQYMSPEQLQGNVTDARSDLFSLGIVLYEMLTGVKPFLGLNIKQIRQAIIHEQYTPITKLNAELRADLKENSKTQSHAEIIAVVNTLLQKVPAERYQTADELAQDLDVIAEKMKKKNNWWQQQHALTKALIIMPLMVLLGWSIRSVIFPPSTQELIARQLVESKKIAFLPFDNISGDPVLQIFSDGIATMLSSDLAEVGYQQGDGTTWVLPASEIRQLDDASVSGIYNKYGVDFIITGSIQHMGSTRSIHLSLVNGSDGRQLKSVQLSINADKLFAAQTQIRQHVITLLGWQIPPTLTQQFAKQKPAFDGAYKHYLQGQGYLYRFDHGDNINKAIEAFQAAIEVDVNYADAYVGLAEAQLRTFITTKDVNLLVPMEKTIALLHQISDNHPLLYYLQGELKYYQGEYFNAIKLFKRSIQQQGNYFRAYIGLSNSYIQLKESARAEFILLTTYELMPNNNAILTELGTFYYSSGNYSRAINFFELLAQQAPNNYIAYLNISASYYLSGNTEQAIISVQKALRIKSSADGYANLGTYYFILKKYDKAVTAYERMIDLNDRDYINWGNLADAYRFANNDKYLDSFNKAILLAEQALELNPYNKKAISSLAYYYANVSNHDKTHFYAKQITEKDSGEDLFVIAAAYARLNIKPSAMKYLTFAVNNNYSIAEVVNSPLLSSLKFYPKYQQLVNAVEKIH